MEVITFNNVSIVYDWKFNFRDDNCAICRNSLMDCSTKCIVEKKNIDTCAPIMGECGHAFHKDCIEDWLSSRRKCPICMQRWKNKLPKKKI